MQEHIIIMKAEILNSILNILIAKINLYNLRLSAKLPKQIGDHIP